MQDFLNTPRPALDTAAKFLLVCSVFFMPLGHAPANVFMALTLIAWLLAGGYRERLASLRNNGFAWAALGLYALLWLGMLHSGAPASDMADELRKYAKLPLMVAAITLLQDETWRARALNAFALAMFITLALSMLSLFWPLAFMKEPAAHSVFKDYLTQNLMMSFFVLLMLVRGKTASGRRMRYACFAVAALAAVNILGMVPGRTGYAALAAVFLVFVLFYASARQRLAWLLCAVIAVGATFQFSDTFRARVEAAVNDFNERGSGQITSGGARLDMIEKSLYLIKEKPLLGWGTGAYPTQYCRLAKIPELCGVGGYHPHNQFLAFGVQLGAIGLLAYALFLASAVWRAWGYARPQKVVALGLIGALLADSMLHAPLFLAGEAQFFILMLAVTLAAAPAPRLHAGALSAA